MNKTRKVLEDALRVLEGLDHAKMMSGRYDVPGDDKHEQVEVEDLIPAIKGVLKKGGRHV